MEPALRALVRSYEYEDWPRGRIVFDQSRDLFIIYADRKLLTPATIARLETQFQLPEERTEIQSDLHYKSTETPKLPRGVILSVLKAGRKHRAHREPQSRTKSCEASLNCRRFSSRLFPTRRNLDEGRFVAAGLRARIKIVQSHSLSWRPGNRLINKVLSQ